MSKPFPIHDVTWLPIHDIAQQWSDETGQSKTGLERALIEWFQQCAYEVDPGEEGTGWIDSALEHYNPFWDGVDCETYMPRTYFEIMCNREGHALPRFWFPVAGNSENNDEPIREPGRRGPRPLEQAYIDLFHELLNKGEINLDENLQTAAYRLKDDKPERELRTVQNYIRKPFTKAKATPRPK